MIYSDFHFTGMQVLESGDPVNWKIVNQIYSRPDDPARNRNKRLGAVPALPRRLFPNVRLYAARKVADEPGRTAGRDRVAYTTKPEGGRAFFRRFTYATDGNAAKPEKQQHNQQ